MQRIPSAFRLRHTQSAPRITKEEPAPVVDSHESRRHSSNPSIGSPISYPFELPDIRRMSVTPEPDWVSQDAMQGTVHACGRGDLIAAHEDFAFPITRRHDPEQATDVITSLHTPARSYIAAPSAISIVSPLSKAKSGRTRPANDYFSEVYANKNRSHRRRTESHGEEEHSDAGPEIEHDPRLQRILRGVLRGEDESDDSDVARVKKRKSLVTPTGMTESAIAERFRSRSQDLPPDST